jgi:hypothetical protein
MAAPHHVARSLMNYLQLVQRLKRKARVAGAMPVTVQNVTVEEILRLMAWTNEAWVDIQLARPDWRWMRKSVSFATQLGKATYSLSDLAVTDFGNWKIDTFRNYATSAGLASEIFMDGDMSYDEWRNTYQYGALRYSTTRPTQIAFAPDFSLCLGPVPVDGYTVLGDYFKVPTEMSLDADTPGLGAQFHMAIVYRAMMFYGMSEASPEVYQEGEKEFNRMMARINLHELSTIELAGALA